MPNEPDNIVQLTKDFISESEPDFVMLSSLCVYPGSPLFDNPKNFGLSYISPNFEDYSTLVGRFRDPKDSKYKLPFRYADGKGFDEDRILRNLKELQDFLIEKGVNK